MTVIDIDDRASEMSVDEAMALIEARLDDFIETELRRLATDYLLFDLDPDDMESRLARARAIFARWKDDQQPGIRRKVEAVHAEAAQARP